MQEYSLHILIVVVVRMAPMRMAMVSMVMSMVGMPEGCKAHNIDDETKYTDDEKLVESM